MLLILPFQLGIGKNEVGGHHLRCIDFKTI